MAGRPPRRLQAQHGPHALVESGHVLLVGGRMEIL